MIVTSEDTGDSWGRAAVAHRAVSSGWAWVWRVKGSCAEDWLGGLRAIALDEAPQFAGIVKSLPERLVILTGPDLHLHGRGFDGVEHHRGDVLQSTGAFTSAVERLEVGHQLQRPGFIVAGLIHALLVGLHLLRLEINDRPGARALELGDEVDASGESEPRMHRHGLDQTDALDVLVDPQLHWCEQAQDVGVFRGFAGLQIDLNGSVNGAAEISGRADLLALTTLFEAIIGRQCGSGKERGDAGVAAMRGTPVEPWTRQEAVNGHD